MRAVLLSALLASCDALRAHTEEDQRLDAGEEWPLPGGMVAAAKRAKEAWENYGSTSDNAPSRNAQQPVTVVADERNRPETIEAHPPVIQKLMTSDQEETASSNEPQALKHAVAQSAAPHSGDKKVAQPGKMDIIKAYLHLDEHKADALGFDTRVKPFSEADHAVCEEDSQLKPFTEEQLRERLMNFASHPETSWKMRKTLPVVEAMTVRQASCGSCSQEFPKRENSKPTVPSKYNELTKIYYVNLEGSDWRRENMEKHLKQKAFGVDFERWPATNKDEAKEVNLTSIAKGGLAPYLTQKYDKNQIWGTVATYLSQYRLLEHILEEDPEGEGIYMVLEDDADLDIEWKKKLTKLIESQVPEDWDLLKLGRPWWSALRCQDKINKYVYESRTPDHSDTVAFYSGNIGWLVRPKSIPKILEQLKDGVIMDVDGAMLSMGNQGESHSEDGKVYYWSWGARTYSIAYPLVKDAEGTQGFGSDRLSFRQKLSY